VTYGQTTTTVSKKCKFNITFKQRRTNNHISWFSTYMWYVRSRLYLKNLDIVNHWIQTLEHVRIIGFNSYQKIMIKYCRSVWSNFTDSNDLSQVRWLITTTNVSQTSQLQTSLHFCIFWWIDIDICSTYR